MDSDKRTKLEKMVLNMLSISLYNKAVEEVAKNYKLPELKILRFGGKFAISDKVVESGDVKIGDVEFFTSHFDVEELERDFQHKVDLKICGYIDKLLINL